MSRIALSIALIAASVSLCAQGIPAIGNLGMAHAIATGVNRVGSKTFDCGSPSSPACSITSVTYAHTGDTAVLFFFHCIDSCASAATNLIAVDGTNTYSAVTNCHSWAAAGNTTCIVAKTVTAGTYTVIVTSTGGAPGNLSFARAIIVELSGANNTTPVDASVTNAGAGTSATPSLTSAGNVSNTGEVILGFFSTANTYTWGAPFTELANILKNDVGYLDHPSSGATVTASGTQTSGTYRGVIVGITP